MKRKILLILTIIIIIGVAVFYWLQPEKNTSILNLYGNVEIRQTDLSFKVPGRIEKLFFDEGDVVKKGDLLASIDKSSYEAQLRKATADAAALSATSINAQANYDRRVSLYQKGAIAKETLDQYKTSNDNTNAQLQAAQDQIIVAADNLRDTDIFSPNDGTITTRARETGAVVAAGNIVYTLTLTEPIWIRTYISEKNLGNIYYNMKVKVITDAIDPATNKNRTYDGYIGFISPVAEFTPKTVQTVDLRSDLVYRLRVYVESSDKFLRQGMPVSLTVNLLQEDKKQ